ncbi:unnamed protein product [Gongylonema pulchrum]|uniref:Uncharacterized protein n=1 Tax=Gongylonema pulchrum TaxID=637853 RepID=A0A183DF96_9BILA|nr:unnamed protein product [Gongylonema pulchrum]
MHTDEECTGSSSTSISEGYESDSVHPLTVCGLARAKTSLGMTHASHELAKVTLLQVNAAHVSSLSNKMLTASAVSYQFLSRAINRFLRSCVFALFCAVVKSLMQLYGI